MIRISRATLRLGAALLALALAACAPLRTRPHASDAAADAAQQSREAALASHDHWTLQAHIGVTTERDSGSGDLEWRQDGAAYTFTVRAPITGKTWRLAGDAHGATLEGVGPRMQSDADVQRLLREQIGWDVPLASLRAWVFGLRAASPAAEVRYDDRELPALIVQGGWNVEYRDWFGANEVAGSTLALPKRVFATHGATRVKLAIYDWSLDR